MSADTDMGRTRRAAGVPVDPSLDQLQGKRLRHSDRRDRGPLGGGGGGLQALSASRVLFAWGRVVLLPRQGSR